MIQYDVTTKYLERTYDHGSITVTHREGVEKKIEILIFLTISDDAEKLRDEIQEVIRKYAI
jgi:hypothetical protein